VKLSSTAKVVLAVSALIGAALFLVILDLGINAGQVHRGVTIDHLNLGGLTELEAVDLLDHRGTKMSQTPITFERQGVRCSFLPSDVGWRPSVHRAVSKALAVGREGSIWTAGDQRLQAWLGGIKIVWPDRPNHRKVGAVLDECEQLAASGGLQVSRWRMRLSIRRALTAWPRRTLPIPIVKD
jgi:hypothetical protein